MIDAVGAALVEGCIGESLAAAEAQAASEVATDPLARTSLQRIAADEARHAELAFRFVAWALPRCDGGAVAEVIDACLRSLAQLVPAAGGLEQETPNALAGLHQAGRLSSYERASVRRRTLCDVLEPCLLALRRPRAA